MSETHRRVFERVAAGMDLRRPQRESLKVVHEVVAGLGRPLKAMTPGEVLHRVRDARPAWEFKQPYARLTFSLATGVGKTRLMGAIMAYLYGLGESRNFLMLAPRDAILRKLEAEARESHPKYLFVERAVVPQPRLCHRGNLLEFDPNATSDGLYGSGPTLFLFSPQLLTTAGRIDQPSPFGGTSIRDFLKRCPDLVVLFDESHHLAATGDERRSWAGAVNGLAPKLLFAMTATPADDDVIAYEYNLGECLREGIYTKKVRLLVERTGEQPPAGNGVSAHDATTLRAALKRLAVKEAAIAAHRATRPAFPPVRPVLLACAANVEHCKNVCRWLVEQEGLKPEQVLRIDSRQKTEADLRVLADIERADSPVRVVVQVHVLDEGWDVSNVYVIAPLRSVQSYRNGRQVMGRGLRLPAGRRVQDDELDTLDVLAFGQETIQAIHEQATTEFGAAVERGGVAVVEASAGGTAAADVKGDEDDAVARFPVVMHVTRPMTIEWPEVDLFPASPDLGLTLTERLLTERGFEAVELGPNQVSRVAGAPRQPRARFVRRVVRRVIEDAPYLSDALHADVLRRELETNLDRLNVTSETDHDPDHLARAIVRAFDERYRLLKPHYRATGHRTTLTLTSAEALVRDQFRGALPGRPAEWAAAYQRLPLDGWQRCMHDRARFDTRPEFGLACRLDLMAGVTAWYRNCPAQIVLPTILRGFAPDFVVWTDLPGVPPVLFVEVKGEHLYQGETTDARVKAANVHDGWAVAAGGGFGIAVIVGADVERVSSLPDLLRLSRA